MSESRDPQMLQGEPSMKRQAASIILICGLVFGLWWGAMGLYDLWTGGSRGRYDAQQDLTQVKGGEFQKIMIPMPNFPPLDLQRLLQYLSEGDLQKLQDLLGGNLNGLDPKFLAAILAADPEARNTVMFRIYDYASQNDVTSRYFRYAAYDAFDNKEWTKTYPGSVPGSFATRTTDTDMTPVLRVRMALSQIAAGEEYSMVAPCVAPTTYLKAGSVYAQVPSLDYSSVNYPYVDEYAVQELHPRFTSSDTQNISVSVWGFERAGGDSYYTSNARSNPALIPSVIRSRYLSFPGGVSAAEYRSTRPNFQAAVTEIEARFATNPGANLFTKANIIRNYMFGKFACDPTQMSTAEDVVEDLCATKVGDLNAYVSALALFCRNFEIPVRVLMGFSGASASEISDPMGSPDFANPAPTMPILLGSLYSWAEVYMPVNDDGTGDWVTFDARDATYTPDYSLRVLVNGTEFGSGMPMFSVDRPSVVNFTVIVTPTGSAPAYSGTAVLYNSFEETSLASVTITGGQGEYLWPVTTNNIAGGHHIRVSVDALLQYVYVGIRGPTNLVLDYSNPVVIDKTQPNQDVEISGYLEDLAYTGARPTPRIPGATCSVTLYTNPGGVAMTDPFSPGYIRTNSAGAFANDTQTLGSSISQNNYTLRVEFYGWFGYVLPGGIFEARQVSAWSQLSNTRPLEVKDPNQVDFTLYINGSSASATVDRVFNQGEVVHVTARVLVGGSPFVATSVQFEFLDNYGGSGATYSTMNWTDSSGWTGAFWTIAPSHYVGPAMVRARFDKGDGDWRFAYGFFVINRTTTLNWVGNVIDSIIDFQDNASIWFQGRLMDNQAHPVLNARIDAMIYTKGSGYTPFYIQSSPQFTNSMGYAYGAQTAVAGSDANGLYDMRLEFWGTYNFDAHPWRIESGMSPGIRSVGGAPTNVTEKRELSIVQSSQYVVRLWVNHTPVATFYDNGNIAAFRFKVWDYVNLSATCFRNGVPRSGMTVRFADTTQGWSQDISTNEAGNASYTRQIFPGDISGPHEITVTYFDGGFSANNYTMIFYNDTIHFSSQDIIINKDKIQRGVTSLVISGNVLDASNNGVHRARVELRLLTLSDADRSGYIVGPMAANTNPSGAYSFSFTISTYLLQGQYKFRLVHTQIIDGSNFAHCPTYLTSASNFNPLQSNDRNVDINATVQFTYATYTPEFPEAGSDLTVNGQVLWDNGTALSTGFQDWINVTVTEKNNRPNVLAMRNLTFGNMYLDGSIDLQVQVTWALPFVVSWQFFSRDPYITFAAVDATPV